MEEKEIIDSPDKPQEKLNDTQLSVKWWESKRYIYNAILFISGVLAYLTVQSWEFFEATSFLMTFILYILVANACYTAGWVFEILLNYYFKADFFSSTGRWVLFVFGSFFSFVITYFGFGITFGPAI